MDRGFDRDLRNRYMQKMIGLLLFQFVGGDAQLQYSSIAPL
jgi:hypothetical protein